MPQSSKRQRTIQTSTPVSKQFGAREVVLIPDEDSPIKTEEEEGAGVIEEGRNEPSNIRTGISDDLCCSRITPAEAQSSSAEGRGLLALTIDWERAAVGRYIIKKKVSEFTRIIDRP